MSTEAPTQVCLTVDTEFSIAGAFSRPDLYRPLADPVVYCEVDGAEHGLGFLMKSLSAYSLPATFFVEALQTTYFGDEPMGRVVRRLHSAGFDIQMHIHPCWAAFRRPDWSDSAPVVANDSCAGRSDEELDRFVEHGLAAFARWELPRPVAARTGGLHVDRAVYRALRRARIPISSSIGLAIYRPSDARLNLPGGRHRIDGVLELPILSYSGLGAARWKEHRALTITGSAFGEMRSLLRKAREKAISPVVILTHPFEFVKTADFRYTKLQPNRVNQSRLLALFDFLRAHDREFEVVSVAQGAPGWLAAADSSADVLSVPAAHALRRILENAINDRIWRF